MNEPTLFDQLAAVEGRRLGTRPASIVAQSVETLDMWAEGGIPADLSTVEHACDLLMALWRERSTWLGLVDELLASMEAQ